MIEIAVYLHNSMIITEAKQTNIWYINMIRILYFPPFFCSVCLTNYSWVHFSRHIRISHLSLSICLSVLSHIVGGDIVPFANTPLSPDPPPQMSLSVPPPRLIGRPSTLIMSRHRENTHRNKCFFSGRTTKMGGGTTKQKLLNGKNEQIWTIKI